MVSLEEKVDKIYFVTDLDRTIIHSKHKGYKCVERMHNREITYMTDKAYEELQELLRSENFIFVPCTMRNINQTMRVDFIKEYNPNIIICSNGAQIYINGELDYNWNNYMKEICDINELIKNIEYLKVLQLKLKDKINILEVRNIEDFYITVKCSDSLEAEKFYEIIKDKFEEKLKVLRIGVKIFIIHEKIDKIHAVDYIIKKFKIKTLITAGDSEVDREFTKRGISILPKHSTFKHDNAIITKKEKISATEDILDILSSIIKKHDYNVNNEGNKLKQ